MIHDLQMEQLCEKVQSMDGELQSLKSEIQELRTGFQTVGKRLKDMETVLEEEIRSNILVMAEGHVSLSHRLAEVLKVQAEWIMFKIRLNTLENRMRLLWERDAADL